jgi:hypothetical protein
MFKVIWFLKRKSGLTHEQFFEHYENSHVPMAHKYFGHLFLEYRRNYSDKIWRSGNDRPDGDHFGPQDWTFGPQDWEFDVITEWVMPDEEAFREIHRIMADPVIGKAFLDDSARFTDRVASSMLICRQVDTGTGGKAP